MQSMTITALEIALLLELVYLLKKSDTEAATLSPPRTKRKRREEVPCAVWY
jgi:hypothetical protein